MRGLRPGDVQTPWSPCRSQGPTQFAREVFVRVGLDGLRRVGIGIHPAPSVPAFENRRDRVAGRSDETAQRQTALD